MKKRPFKKIILAAFLVIFFSLILTGILPQELSQRYFYKALWFKALWFIIAICIIVSIIGFFKRKDLGLAIVYLGFFLILLGGSLTSLLGQEGFIEIKEGQSIDGFWIEDEVFQPLDFSLSLRDFSVEFYPEAKKGMQFVKSYKSVVDISKDDNLLKEAMIEVNRPLNFGGFGFYQYGYDAELPNQTILQVVKDPGLPFVYSGYLLLLFGLVFSFKKIWKI